MRSVGLHIRVTDTLTHVAEKAARLQMPLFQCFLVSQQTGRLLTPSEADIAQFVRMRSQFEQFFVHSSYWVNLSGSYNAGHALFARELELAKKLQGTHIIVHPGAAKGVEQRVDGIDVLAKTLNRLLVREHDITLVLENTAHGGMSIGGDLTDFALLLSKLDHPEKIRFCIDTAHAHVYGYPLATDQERTTFIDLLARTIGLEAIMLVHLNDAHAPLGSKLDRHALIGEGTIGIDNLRALVNDQRIRHIPLLLELPVVEEKQEIQMLDLVRNW